MNWLGYFALGIVSGWALKSLQIEWRMQALSDFVFQELKDMRDEWRPGEVEIENLRRQFYEAHAGPK